jgi:hypothetical protein
MHESATLSEFEKLDFPFTCQECERNGYFFVESYDNSYFVVCSNCGAESSNVWCPKCSMGGSYVDSIIKHPKSWACPGCDTRYNLPAMFYENPRKLYGIEELPPEVQERITLGDQATGHLPTLRGLIGAPLTYTIVFVLSLWPLIAGYTLMNLQHNNLWLLIGLISMIVWVFYGFPKTLGFISAAVIRSAKTKRER